MIQSRNHRGTLSASAPFSTLKIDRSLVLGLESPPRARLFEGIVQLAEGLGLQTLAEGVETEVQRGIIRELGCQLGRAISWVARSRPSKLRRFSARSRRVNLGIHLTHVSTCGADPEIPDRQPGECDIGERASDRRSRL
jgi:predicted signal transduction protein with EAL and GGDEF domain